MKHLRRSSIVFVLIIILSVGASAQPFAPGNFDVSSPHALLMDMSSGLLLYQKGVTERLFPASTTKIMSAIVALEANPDFDAKVTVSDNAVASTPVGSSSMGLRAGEVVTFGDLIYGMMVYSANDAANAIAEYISGDIPSFVKKMNEKAAALGATDTHFVTPHGFHDPDHYSTAYDMALFARFAMTDPTISPTFRKIVSTETYTIEPTNLYPEKRIMQNTNLLLPNTQDKRYILNEAIGIKTGHTSESGYCLVSAINKNGQELLAVVMGAGIEDGLTMSYMDSLALYGYAGREFQRQVIASAGDSLAEAPIKNAFGSRYILLNAKEDFSVMLPIGYDPALLTNETDLVPKIKAPVKEGKELGTITYFYNGETLGTIPLVADKTYHLNPLLFLLNGFIWIITSPWFFIPVLAMVIFITSVRLRRRHRRQQKRIAQRKALQEENARKERESQREFETSIHWDEF